MMRAQWLAAAALVGSVACATTDDASEQGVDTSGQPTAAVPTGGAQAAFVDELEEGYLKQLNTLEARIQALEEAAELEREDARDGIMDLAQQLREKRMDAYDRVQSLDRAGEDRAELEEDIDGAIRNIQNDLRDEVEALSPPARANYDTALRAVAGEDVSPVGAFGLEGVYIEQLNDLRFRVQALEEAAEDEPDAVRASIMEAARGVREKYVDTYGRVQDLRMARPSARAELVRDIEGALESMENETTGASRRLSPTGEESLIRDYERLLNEGS